MRRYIKIEYIKMGYKPPPPHLRCAEVTEERGVPGPVLKPGSAPMGRSDQNRGLGAKIGSQSVCNRKPPIPGFRSVVCRNPVAGHSWAVTPNVPGVGGWVVKYYSLVFSYASLAPIVSSSRSSWAERVADRPKR